MLNVIVIVYYILGKQQKHLVHTNIYLAFLSLSVSLLTAYK